MQLCLRFLANRKSPLYKCHIVYLPGWYIEINFFFRIGSNPNHFSNVKKFVGISVCNT